MKKTTFISIESRRIIDMVRSDIDEALSNLKKNEDNPMLSVWTRCATCGHPYENYRSTCSKCGRKYD